MAARKMAGGCSSSLFCLFALPEHRDADTKERVKGIPIYQVWDRDACRFPSLCNGTIAFSSKEVAFHTLYTLSRVVCGESSESSSKANNRDFKWLPSPVVVLISIHISFFAAKTSKPLPK
jgi:hypothetical protein